MRHVRLLQAIDKVARLGSIRRAAEAIALSPSALNRQILTVEEEIGATLFERLPRGVRLSTAGEIYLKCFRAHLAELDRAASQVADLSGLRAGMIRFGVCEELASAFAAEAIAQYQADHPLVDVSMQVLDRDQVSRALRDFDVDIAVAVNCLHDETIETLHAETAEVFCVSSENSDLPPRLHLSSLTDRPLIVPSEASGMRAALDAAFTVRNTPRRYALEIDRLSPSLLRRDVSAVQFALGLEIRADLLEAEGLQIHAIEPMSAPPATVALLGLRRRALPIPVAKFADDLTRAIAA